MGSGDRERLERFVEDNPDLERLEALLAEFNIFEALGPTRRELRHSDFLALLLNPRGNHGLGDAFLKRLLARVATTTPMPPMEPAEIRTADLTDAWVDREWQNIDILVRAPSIHLVCAIENKVESSEHSDQLRRYREIVEQRFADKRRLFVYLTPDGADPSDREYVSLSYHQVVEIVESLCQSQELSLDPAVQMLMEQYVALVRRHVLEDSEIIQLCRKIYREQREALELIWEHRLDLQDELSNFLAQLVDRTPAKHGLRLQHATKWGIH